MKGPWSSLGVSRVVSGSITIPSYGLWTADVDLADDFAPNAELGLTVGDLTLACAIVRGAQFAGGARARIVGSATSASPGWRSQVPAQAYSSPGGLTLSLVLADVAAVVGERVAVLADAPIGNAFVRELGPAARVLRQLAGALWWIAPDGTTTIGPRVATPILSPFELIDHRGESAWSTVATETLSDWMPGRTFVAPTLTTPQTISMVRHTIDGDGTARTEVLAA